MRAECVHSQKDCLNGRARECWWDGSKNKTQNDAQPIITEHSSFVYFAGRMPRKSIVFARMRCWQPCTAGKMRRDWRKTSKLFRIRDEAVWKVFDLTVMMATALVNNILGMGFCIYINKYWFLIHQLIYLNGFLHFCTLKCWALFGRPSWYCQV